jgi:hypothetical protein
MAQSRLLHRRVLRSVMPLLAGMTLCGSAVAVASGPLPQAGDYAAPSKHGDGGASGQGQPEGGNAAGGAGQVGVGVQVGVGSQASGGQGSGGRQGDGGDKGGGGQGNGGQGGGGGQSNTPDTGPPAAGQPPVQPQSPMVVPAPHPAAPAPSAPAQPRPPALPAAPIQPPPTLSTPSPGGGHPGTHRGSGTPTVTVQSSPAVALDPRPAPMAAHTIGSSNTPQAIPGRTLSSKPDSSSTTATAKRGTGSGTVAGTNAPARSVQALVGASQRKLTLLRYLPVILLLLPLFFLLLRSEAAANLLWRRTGR